VKGKNAPPGADKGENNGTPFARNTNPSFVALDASGRFLYLASQAGLITFLANSSNGAVTQISAASGNINNSHVIATTP
jgi:hypothetical protein